MNDLKYLCNYIGLDYIPNSFTNCYSESKKYFKDSKLELDQVINGLNYYKLSDSIYMEKCFKCVELINNDKSLKDIYDLMYYILFIDDKENYKDFWEIKNTPYLFKSHGSLFLPIIVILTAYGIHDKNMKTINFDNKQIGHHIDAIRQVCTDDINKKKLDGIRLSQMVWGSYFINTRIIQVGRLQYELSRYKYDLKLPFVKHGEYIIKIHIPNGNKLSIDDVKKSICDSKKYILKYFKGNTSVFASRGS